VNLYICPYKDEQPFDLEYCENLMKEKKIAMVAMVHASNVLGSILPAKQVGELAHKYGVTFLLDSAQTAGVLDVDVQSFHVDMLAFPGHKGLYGPSGIGGLYVSKNIELNTFVEGGTGNDSGKHEMNSSSVPDSFEVGTIPIHLILAMEEGVKWVLEQTPHKIYQHEISLLAVLLKSLSKIPHVHIYGTQNLDRKVPVVSFFIDNTNPCEVSTLLNEKYKITTRGGFHCAPLVHETLQTLGQKGTIRASLGFHNTVKDVEALISAVKEISAQYNK